MGKALSRIVAVIAAVTGLSAIVGYGLCREAESAPPGAAPPAAAAARPIAPTIVGMNLGRMAYWSPEWPFNDIIKNAGEIRVVDTTGRWSVNPQLLTRDANGRPAGIKAGTQIIAIIELDAKRAMAGTYQCHISPGWAIRPFGDAQVQGTGTSFTLKIPSPVPVRGAALILSAQRDGASLTELSCPAGGALLNPAFLEDNRPFRVLRFMDWMSTNNAPHRTWAARPTPNSFSQGGADGVAVEYMVEVANTLKSDPWFNMPFYADPDYYRQFATYVRDHLARDRKIYVEYSNEVWNVSFQQGRDALRLGQARYPQATPSQAQDWYYADRVREVMAIWSDVFRGQESRLVRVLGTQVVNPRRAEQALSHEDTFKSVDAVAGAPYFGGTYSGPAAPGPARVSAILAEAQGWVDQSINWAKADKAVASRYGLRFIAYESGPSFVVNGVNPLLTQDNYAVGHDPRLYDVYTRFLTRWRNEIGDLIVLFDSVSNANNYAYYAHKDYTGQPLSEAPKMRAAQDFANAVNRD